MSKSYILLTIILAGVGFAGSFYITKNVTPKFKRIPLEVVQKDPMKIIAIPVTDDPAPILAEVIEPKKIPKNIPCPTPKKAYTDESYANVNQIIPLSDPSYIPTNLIALPTAITTANPLCLKKDAALALENMINSGTNDNIHIKVTSGFRSYNTQQDILDRNLKEKNTTVSTSVAKPGYSEHQLGVTVDLTSSAIANASASGLFEGTPEDMWLRTHAATYGFVQSYPKGKESITGYIYEPWHYRYVGVDNAKDIIESSKTVTEFFGNKTP